MSCSFYSIIVMSLLTASVGHLKSAEESSVPTEIMLTKEGSRWRCSHCGKSYCDHSNAKRHAHDFFYGKSFQCTLCDRKYSRKEALKKHLKKCGEGAIHGACKRFLSDLEETQIGDKLVFKKASDGSFPFVAESTILASTNEKVGIVKTWGRVYSCVQCSKKFTSYSRAQRHERRERNKKCYKCSACDRSFARGGLIRAHIKRQHSETGGHVIEIPSQLTTERMLSLPQSSKCKKKKIRTKKRSFEKKDHSDDSDDSDWTPGCSDDEI